MSTVYSNTDLDGCKPRDLVLEPVPQDGKAIGELLFEAVAEVRDDAAHARDGALLHLLLPSMPLVLNTN